MRILFIAQRVPYPPDRGDKITTYHEVRHLSRRHEVSVACLADGKSDLANVARLEEVVASVDAVVLRRVSAKARALISLLGKKPFTVGYFCEHELHQRIEFRMRERQFDAIIVYSSGMAQYAEQFTSVPRIMQFADLDSLKWNQYANNSAWPKSWIFSSEHRRLLEYERHIAYTFSHSLVCTPHELSDIKRLIPGASASCVSNGVDLEYFNPVGLPKHPLGLVFTGVMDYYPNVEGAVWFSNEVLPLIRRENPHVTFTICGARPNARVIALGRLPGVTVTGRVKDIRPYLEQASVCVVPLHIARGVQNKTIEAMAMGLPVVTCSAAFAGVEAVPDAELFVADDPIAFATTVNRLLSDENLRKSVGTAARACMEANYSWDRQLARLDSVLESSTAAHVANSSAAATR